MILILSAIEMYGRNVIFPRSGSGLHCLIVLFQLLISIRKYLHGRCRLHVFVHLAESTVDDGVFRMNEQRVDFIAHANFSIGIQIVCLKVGDGQIEVLDGSVILLNL